MNLFQEFEERKIDYDNLIKDVDLSPSYLGDEVDVSIIIPVHGRTQFNHIISKAFLSARAKLYPSRPIQLTFVEHSENPEHQKLVRDWVNYIWIPQNGQRFNKCLCFNIGVLYGPKAKYYLFHDSDILVPENFFELLFENMKQYDAVQAFSGQRLFHVDRYLTEKILNGEFTVAELKTDTKGVVPARAGAEGGSIFCTRELFLSVGGFSDAFYSEYSVEDAAFWRYIHLLGTVGYCNNRPIDCFHLWHEPSFNRQTKNSDWEFYRAYMAMNEDGKKHFLKLQSEHFKKYINEQDV